MTYNIHRWAGKDGRLDVSRLEGVIRHCRADVVALNEVLHPISDGEHDEEPLAELAERLDMHYIFGASGWVDYGPGWHGRVGNALLSRFPMAEATNAWLPRLLGSKQRSLLGATLAGGPCHGLTAYVTHLDHAFEGTRLLQIDGILKQLSPYQPHFLAGDFNTPGFLGQRSHHWLPPVLRRMQSAGYQDAFGAVGCGSGKTFPSHAPLFRLDFLFMPDEFAGGLRSAQAVSHEGINDASDHRPVVVEWGWPPADGTPECAQCPVRGMRSSQAGSLAAPGGAVAEASVSVTVASEQG